MIKKIHLSITFLSTPGTSSSDRTVLLLRGTDMILKNYEEMKFYHFLKELFFHMMFHVKVSLIITMDFTHYTQTNITITIGITHTHIRVLDGNSKS